MSIVIEIMPDTTKRIPTGHAPALNDIVAKKHTIQVITTEMVMPNGFLSFSSFESEFLPIEVSVTFSLMFSFDAPGLS